MEEPPPPPQQPEQPPEQPPPPPVQPEERHAAEEEAEQGWRLFSQLIKDVFSFFLDVAQEGVKSKPRDKIELRLLRGSVMLVPQALKRTVYQRKLEIIWRAEDMQEGYREAFSDCFGAVRQHWKLLREAFDDYDLRVQPMADHWKVEVCLPKPGHCRIQYCIAGGYMVRRSSATPAQLSSNF
jgi:hypothetical protein